MGKRSPGLRGKLQVWVMSQALAGHCGPCPGSGHGDPPGAALCRGGLSVAVQGLLAQPWLALALAQELSHRACSFAKRCSAAPKLPEAPGWSRCSAVSLRAAGAGGQVWSLLGSCRSTHSFVSAQGWVPRAGCWWPRHREDAGMQALETGQGTVLREVTSAEG